MNRREAISMVSLVVGGTVVGASAYLSGCKPKRRKSIFGILDNMQVETLEEVAESILPKTEKSPGAKDVEIGKFMNTYVTDCYNSEEQKVLIDGLLQLDTMCDTTFGDAFIDLEKKERTEIVALLEDEAAKFNKQLQQGQAPHFYSMIKQLTLLGYVTSELVGTTVFRHVPIPGRYEGCIPYEQGEKAFI